MSVLSSLSPEQHADLRKTLDDVMMRVSSLQGEMAEMRLGLRDIANSIVEDMRSATCQSKHSDGVSGGAA